MAGRLSQKLRGQAWMYAVMIYSITPGQSSLPQFKDGETPHYVMFNAMFDASIIPVPFGCTVSTKIIGTKSC
jgi:hypothetical protein